MDYGLRPVEYKTSFIKMANAVHNRSNLTAMMWSPNIGYQYPFGAQLSDLENLDTEMIHIYHFIQEMDTSIG
jgi:hypothetical protein